MATCRLLTYLPVTWTGNVRWFDLDQQAWNFCGMTSSFSECSGYLQATPAGPEYGHLHRRQCPNPELGKTFGSFPELGNPNIDPNIGTPKKVPPMLGNPYLLPVQTIRKGFCHLHG